MKVLSAEQIKIADKNSILNEPISSIDLMERAAEKCCEFFPPKGQWSHLVVICGIGNNGGEVRFQGHFDPFLLRQSLKHRR